MRARLAECGPGEPQSIRLRRGCFAQHNPRFCDAKTHHGFYDRFKRGDFKPLAVDQHCGLIGLIDGQVRRAHSFIVGHIEVTLFDDKQLARFWVAIDLPNGFQTFPIRIC